MANILDFLIKLQANEGNVTSVVNKTEQQLDEITKKASTVGSALQKAFSFDNLKSSLMSIPGMSFLMNPYTLIASGIGAVTALGAEAEKTSVAFRVLVGDESKAAQLLGDINDFAAATPFSKLNLESAAQTMLNFGVASTDVMTRLQQLGDISMGDSQKLNSLSLVFGQVSASGKLMGQDLLQFINAGFNPLKELQAMTGKSYEELQDMMSKGQIGADAVAAAMKHATDEGGQFHGMMEQQSQSVAGKWSTAIGVVQQKAVEIYDKIQPLILNLVDLFQSVAGVVMDVVTTVVGAISNVIDFIVKWQDEFMYLGVVVGIATVAFNAHNIILGVYTGVMTVVTGATKAVTVATKAWETAQWLLNVAMDANPIGIVTTLIAGLVAGIVYCWNKFAGFRAFILTMWDTMKGFGNIIKDYVINRIQTLVSGLGKVASALAKLFKGDFKGAWEDAKEGFKDVSGVTSAEGLVNKTKDLTSGFSGNYKAHLQQEEKKQAEASETSGAKQTASNAISTPGLSGSAEEFSFGAAEGDKKKGTGSGAKKTAQAAVTGGTRNTSITMSISKFFDNINVYMADKTDTAELEKIILQSLNRSLAIATSTDR